MEIYGMMVNRITNPVGYELNQPRFSYKVHETGAKRQEAAQVKIALDEDMQTVLFDSGRREDIDSLCYVPDITLSPRTRYWWTVAVWGGNGETAVSRPAYFETGKMNEPYSAKWITADIPGNTNLYQSFELSEKPDKARVYIVGLGLYELFINGAKVSDELLTPFFNAYDQWIQVQTYDIAEYLKPGENQILVMLGDGWYKGRFGFQGKTALFGDTQALLMEMHLSMSDGSKTVIGTDESWQAGESKVRFANIYDGETYDAAFDDTGRVPAKLYQGLDFGWLHDRLSLPVRVTERISPKSIITTPAGELVLDLGQEITGYLEFHTQAEKGQVLKLSYGEILQDGNFYNDNLRSAKQEYTYISDGTKAVVRPHFTFFGFRYVKLDGFVKPALCDFTGCVVHSDLPVTTVFSCGNEKVNRLYQNALWGQRGNFLDVPTDCPQRDERMGWTGDAQVFSGTALYQMDSGAFYTKYLFDMRMEQLKLNGSIPHVVPKTCDGDGSCAWADAAAVIPWNLYLFTGDRVELQKQYPLMRDWVEWIISRDEENGSRRLWDTGFHFADWLALDTKDGTPTGGTDPHFIASAYYYYSVTLLLKAARVLGYERDTERYEKLKQEIFNAFQREYFTPAGRLAQTTQTGYVCALFMGLAKEEQVPLLCGLLRKEFREAKDKLRTGFVGTAYLNRTLSQAGLNDLAYSLLLNEEFPGWLYEVNMGATTVWERWNSVLPDGKISGTEMNSLNHYAYGAIMEWVYRDVAGLSPVEENPGFRSVLMRPLPDERLGSVNLAYESAAGLYQSRWHYDGKTFSWEVEIPFGCKAKAVFPFADEKTLSSGYKELTIQKENGEVYALLNAGRYNFSYPV